MPMATSKPVTITLPLAMTERAAVVAKEDNTSVSALAAIGLKRELVRRDLARLADAGYWDTDQTETLAAHEDAREAA